MQVKKRANAKASRQKEVAVCAVRRQSGSGKELMVGEGLETSAGTHLGEHLAVLAACGFGFALRMLGSHRKVLGEC